MHCTFGYIYMHTIFEYLLFVFLLSFGIQELYYLFFYSRVSFSKPKKKHAHKQPVSVIICARDEAENLKENLPGILEQDYPDFEVVVINDCSKDYSSKVLEAFQAKHGQLKVTTIKKDPKFSHGKKLALTIGIKAAINEWLLLTDADCKQESNQWISQMAKNFTTKTSIVLGYGGYNPKPTLLNNYIRFDTFFIAMQYLGFALGSVPYMGVGRNLAYRKSVFFKNKGFASHLDIQSGDDDLFIGEVARKDNTQIEFSTPATVRGKAKATLSEWGRQKRRHLSTGWHYRSKIKWLLGLEITSRLLFYLIFLILLFSNHFVFSALCLFAVRTLTMGVIFKFGMTRLKDKNLLLSSFFWDAISPIINLILTFINFLSSEKPAWK